MLFCYTEGNLEHRLQPEKVTQQLAFLIHQLTIEGRDAVRLIGYRLFTCQPSKLVPDVVMSDLQMDQLLKDYAEKAVELDRTKDELEKCDSQRLDLSEQLTILSADKNIADADLKASNKQAALQKKESEVFLFVS